MYRNSFKHKLQRYNGVISPVFKQSSELLEEQTENAEPLVVEQKKTNNTITLSKRNLICNCCPAMNVPYTLQCEPEELVNCEYSVQCCRWYDMANNVISAGLQFYWTVMIRCVIRPVS